MSEELNKKESKIFFYILMITVFFNIWFPKAGIKIAGIPLTIGNVFFGVLFVIWILKKIRKPIKINKIGVVIIIGILYFFVRLIIPYFYGETSLSDLMGYLIPLVVYPLIYFIIIDTVDTEEKMEKIIKIIVWGFFFLTLYALLQYIFGINTVAIPGLTVNLTDYKELGEYWFLQKSNGSDTANAKIVGTYQNGNLFGIGILLIYPLVYNYLNQKKKNKLMILSLILFVVTVFLTLSRSCWLGIFLFIFIEIMLKRTKNKKSILLKIFIIIFFVLGIIVVFEYVPSVANRFYGTDASDWISMSGRTEGIIEVFSTISETNNIFAYIIGPYGIAEYSGLAYEVLWLSVFVKAGIIGMILLYYIFIKAISNFKSKNYITHSIRIAIIIWLIVAFIECGYWLPPAALNIFMLIGLGYAQNEIERKKQK